VRVAINKKKKKRNRLQGNIILESVLGANNRRTPPVASDKIIIPEFLRFATIKFKSIA
jgi:hypothetical protein